MNWLLIILLSLILYIFLWFVINLVLYYLSIFTKKKVILESFFSVSIIFLQIYSFILSVSLFWFGIELFKSQEYLWLIFYIFLGSRLLGGLFRMASIPFVAIPAYYANKLDEHVFDDKVVEAEILDNKGRVVGITEGDSVISRRLSGYFLGLYIFNVIYMYFNQEPYIEYTLAKYLLTSFVQVMSSVVIFGIPYAIYYKIRYKSYFPEDKRYFFIQAWKISLIVQLVLLLFIYLFF